MTVNNSSTTNDPSQSVSLPIKSGLLWLALAAVGMIAFFWDGFVSLAEAWTRPEYSHGYLIPLIAAFLFLRQMRDSDEYAGAPGGALGISVILAGMCVGLLGNLTHIPDILTYGFLTCLAGFVLILAGGRQGLNYWAPWMYLAFMLPLPNFIYWKLSTKLQTISSEIGVAIISWLGVPVYLDGNIIDLGNYKLQVAEACSGLNYLFPLMSFGFLFAVLYRGPVWHKIVLFLSAIPITVFMNCIRIAVIGVLVDSYGIEQAEGFLHFFEGWVIFLACISLLYLEILLLQRLTAAPKPIHAMLDLDTHGLGAQLSRVLTIVPSRSLVAASIAVASAGLVWQMAPSQSATIPDRQQFALFPKSLGDWQGQSRERLDPEIERVLAADDYLVMDYRNKTDKSQVNLFIAYYASLTSGSGIHSPEVCLPSGGWEVSNIASVDTGFRFPSGSLLKVNRAIIQKGLNRQLVYYWFEQRGRRLTNDYVAKGFTVWDSMVKGRADGALVRLVTPLSPGKPASAGDKRLNLFLGETYKKLSRYVPE